MKVSEVMSHDILERVWMRASLMVSRTCPLGIMTFLYNLLPRDVYLTKHVSTLYIRMHLIVSTVYVLDYIHLYIYMYEYPRFTSLADSDSLGGIFSTRIRVERKQNQLMGSVLYSNGNSVVVRCII